MMKRNNIFTARTFIIVALLLVAAWSFNMHTRQAAQSITHNLKEHADSLIVPNNALAQNIGNTSIADVTEKSIESVVNIYSEKVIKTSSENSMAPFFNDPFFRRFFGDNFQQNMPKDRRQRSLGSGVIVSEDGVIITNNHVVDGADELKVTLLDEREYEAEILGTDPKSDIAVIRLKGDVSGLKPLHFGDSDELRLGEVVLAIGNPFGLQHTVTMGIVSAKGRSGRGIEEYEDFIQTDAAINPGNSGGALINMDGDLVGINTAILSTNGGFQAGNQGIGFAIPSNMAQMIMDELIEHGKVVRGWLGVNIQDVTNDIAEAMGLSSLKGALVADVLDDTPAQKAGLKTGDIIIRLDGDEVKNVNELRNDIALHGADVTVTLTVLRDGKEKNIKVKLGELPEDEQLASMGSGSGSARESAFDGISVAPVNRTTRNNYQIPNDVDSGVIVTGIEEGSPAQQTGLQPGDIIMEVNRNPVDSIDAFKKEYKKAGDNVLLYVYRNGSRFFRVLKK